MIEHHETTINGIRMHYVTAGGGEPILFLHGFPEYWGVWKKQIAEFSASHRVLAPDLRGANKTERPTRVEDHGIDHLVGDVLGLLDHEGIERVNLVCQDWGGLLGWTFLLRHPGRVSRFVSINVTHPALLNRDLRENPAQQQASQYMLAFRRGGEDMILANDGAFIEQALFADARAHGADFAPEDEAEWRALLKDRGHLSAGLNCYRAAKIGPPDGEGGEGGSNLLDGLSAEQLQVDTPVLVIWGDEDTFLLATGLEGLGDLVSDLTVKHIPDASHWVTLEKPALVTQYIREFFER